MEARRIRSTNFNEDVFGLVPIDMSGDEIQSLPLLNGRLEPRIRNQVWYLRGEGKTYLVRLACKENGAAPDT